MHMDTVDPGRLPPFRLWTDEQTRARWARVLEDHRRAAAGIAALQAAMGGGKAVRLGAMLRQFDQSAARLGPLLRQFQRPAGDPERGPQ
jgi:hypothetical protein